VTITDQRPARDWVKVSASQEPANQPGPRTHVAPPPEDRVRANDRSISAK
jgi:hypothetical protein